MSGLEPLVAAAAPGLLSAAAKTLLPKVMAKVARSVTFRFRVYLSVRRERGLRPSMRLYLKWLREVAKTDLHEPLEVTGARLATTLDEALSIDWKWRVRTDRRSAALRLVEETYIAILTLVEAADARVLQERWARQRHEALLAAISTMNGLTGFSRADVASLLLRESHNRRLERLRSFGLDDDQVTGLVDLMAGIAPDVLPGDAVMLVGPFGSGKSEQAESWFARAAASYRDSEDAPVPMWFHASALAATAVDQAVRSRINDHDVDISLALVIDGLDEVDPDIAYQIAKQVRVLVATHRASSAVMTTRPGVFPSDDTDVPCRGLDDREMEAVVNLVGGGEVSTWGWNEDLRDSVRRPFFAIAVGRAHRDGISVYGQATLIRHLVERALEDPATKKSAVQRSEIYELLENLAVRLTDTGSQDDGLTYAKRQQALRSRLVREVNGRAEFALPIFQQWFAAQSLIAHPQRVDDAAADPVLFSRWRWALAVAGSAASSSSLDDLLERCIRGNPGAGAWVQTEIASGHHAWRDDTDATPEVAEAKSRLLLAARVWVDAFGRVAPHIYPIRSALDPITLGVGVHGTNVSLAWSSEIAEEDRSLDFPDDVHPLLPLNGPWRTVRTGRAAGGNQWPWQMVLDRTEKGLRNLFLTGVLGPADGVWRDERRHQLIRELTKTRSKTFPPVNRDNARNVVASILEGIPDPLNSQLALNDRVVADGNELLDLQDWLSAYPHDEITRPLATPDVLDSRAGWVWSMYSPERIEQFTAEMLGRACDAYDEAATEWFPTFSWSFGTGEPGTFGVLAELVHSEEDKEHSPGLGLIVVPLHIVEEELDRQAVPFIKSSNGRVAVTTTYVKESRSDGYLYRRAMEWWRDNSSRFHSSSPFAELSYSNRLLDMVLHERPASGIAVEWLWEDLRRLRLVSSSSPEIR